MWFFRRKKGADPQATAPSGDMRFIGRVEFQTSIYEGSEKNIVEVMKHTALLSMNDNGTKRHVRYLSQNDHHLTTHPIHHRCEVWLAGGPFPPNITLHEDILGDMLSRVIDARLTGKETA